MSESPLPPPKRNAGYRDKAIKSPQAREICLRVPIIDPFAVYRFPRKPGRNEEAVACVRRDCRRHRHYRYVRAQQVVIFLAPAFTIDSQPATPNLMITCSGCLVVLIGAAISA